jgi:uncharacterized membrane protein YbhN (UPF0104 family)
MPAQAITLDVAATDPIAALKRAGSMRHNSRVRKIVIAAGMLAAAVAVAIVAPGVVEKFGDAFVRALHADPGWVIGGVGLELASFAGYIALFWYVANRATPRIGLRASGEIALASTAATRLLPTAGAGGAALTFWSLRRAGQDNGTATRTLLSFLVVLYSVFLGSILVAGTLLATGAVASDVPFELSAVPAAAAAVGIALALVFALRHDAGFEPAGRLSTASHALGGAVRDALSIVRRPDPRLAGAVAWWAFDLLVLWATFNAFGEPPAATVLVLGYFLGQVANTVPLPGAASGGMVGAFLALGMPAEVVLPAVLAYRAIAIWTPVPAGAAALAGLRRRVRVWAVEDGIAGDEVAAEADAGDATVVPMPARMPVPSYSRMPLAA